MEKHLKNAIVGQSGGPTAAINATLAGVIRGALDAKGEGKLGTLYGMRYGIEGALSDNLIDLCCRFADPRELDALENTPAAALGSCRRKLKSHTDDPDTYDRLFALFAKYNIGYFFYIGGNDSMDTVHKLSVCAEERGYDLRVIGVPKTIDNDLAATDHTPGFGSAAKYVATTVKEILRDVSVYTVKAVTIVEIMGRDAGWLTASAALPYLSGGMGPDLIYLPEVPFDTDAFIASVRAAMERHPAVLVCVSEGIRFADGEYVGAGTQSGAVDVFGHKYLAGAARVLESVVKERLGCKVRSIELSLPQRCGAHLCSLTDIRESVAVGRAAVASALSGLTGVMMTYRRTSDTPYEIEIVPMPIGGIANAVRAVPREYINETGDGITEAGLRYLAPLILGETSPIYENGLPYHIVL